MFVAVVVAAAIVGYCRGLQWLLLHRRQRCLGRVRIVALLHHHRPLIVVATTATKLCFAAAVVVGAHCYCCCYYCTVYRGIDSIRFSLISRIGC